MNKTIIQSRIFTELLSKKHLKNTTNKAVFTDRDTLQEVVECLAENLSIKSQRDCKPTDLFNILVGAASKADTIENTASALKNSFSPRKIRYHLNNKFKSFKELENQLNQGLISKLPRRIKKRKHKNRDRFKFNSLLWSTERTRTRLYL